ncbi:hypothetical protein B0H14DRAFT_3431142 [Mycena olivaceomarginata]|nr:hypothetical protein B0H14DRAFT_3431142 [Mycena olivaceomarginata]
MANVASAPVPTATSPEQQLEALISQVTAMSMLAVDFSERCIDVHDKEMSRSALDIARQCIDINAKIPRVVRAHVDAAVDELRSPTPAFYEHIAPTPDEIAASVPTGQGDNQMWYVVVLDADLACMPPHAEDEVRGVPRGSCRKVLGRVSALAHYRQMYDTGKVRLMSEEIPSD